MKRKLIILMLPLLALFGGCEKEMMGYQGKEGVYFAVRSGSVNSAETSWPYMPYSTVDFVRLAKDETTFSVKVSITGPVKDYNRTFRVEVNPDSTTAILGQHYEPIANEWTIPAGAISTNIFVKAKRTSDLLKLTKTLGLRLVATKDFELSFPEWDAIPSLTGGTVVKEFDATLHTIRLTDVMQQPPIWLGSLQAGNREGGTYGVFTRKKMDFLTQYTGVKYEDFASDATMPLARSLLVASDAAKILIKLYNEGTPMLEDDGRLMFIGNVPWTSYIGVPWVKP